MAGVEGRGELYTQGARAWPAFHVARERFVAAAGDRDVVAEDLYLALACSDGNEAAIAALRDAYVPALRQALGKLGGMTAATIDEVVQRVLVIVFVGEAGPPQITTYTGRGTLRSWLRTIGVRTGRRQLGSRPISHPTMHCPTSPRRPRARDACATRYRDQVKHAFATAFAELADRERNVLRQYHIDGLTIDQLATSLPGQPRDHGPLGGGRGGSPSSPARENISSRSYGIAATEVDSIIRLVRSQLDVSVRELAN